MSDNIAVVWYVRYCRMQNEVVWLYRCESKQWTCSG